jgi:hypothetical protein
VKNRQPEKEIRAGPEKLVRDQTFQIVRNLLLRIRELPQMCTESRVERGFGGRDAGLDSEDMGDDYTPVIPRVGDPLDVARLEAQDRGESGQE